MSKSFGRLVLSVCFLTISFSFTAEARKRGEHRGQNPQQQITPADPSAPDYAIARATEGKKRVNFVEGAGMIVTQLLPDDTSGLRHQKWMVRLSNGKQIQAIYNLDMCPHIPLRVGDEVSMGGMYIPTGKSGIIHWLHYAPRHNRPDGYVEVNGTYYCKN